MSSLHKRQHSPYWWGKFRDDMGVTRFRSTKKTKRDDAQEIVLAWQRSATSAKAGELTKAVVLKTLNEMLERTTGERVEVFTVRKFFADWLKAKTTTGKSAGTVERYKPILKGFVKFLGEKRANISIAGVTATDIERFRDLESGSGKSAASANLAVSVLRAVFSDARRKGILLTNPAEAVELVHAAPNERQPFTDDTIALLLAAADWEWRGMILLGAHAGLRIGDAARLIWTAIDLTAGTLTFAPQKTSRRTHGKPQRIAMHPELHSYFVGLPKNSVPNKPIFPTLHNRTAGGHQGLSNAFAALMTKAGIAYVVSDKPKGKGRGFSAFSFHSLRHTFISRLANAGITADVRKEIAGHSSDEIHRRYTHLDVSTQQRALNSLKPFVTAAIANTTVTPLTAITLTSRPRR